MRFVFLAALALAACHPDANPYLPADAGTVVPADAPDAMPIDATPPIAPPTTAMETLSGAGRMTQGDITLDVQLGGFARGASSDADKTLDTNPVLH